MNKEKIELEIKELESKSSLSKSEVFKLARYKVMLTQPEVEEQRQSKRLETFNNKTAEEKELIRKNQSESRLSSEKAIKSYSDSERNKKISISLTGRKRSKESIEKQRQKLLGRKLSKRHREKIAKKIKERTEKYGNPRKHVKWFEVEGIKCQGRSEKGYITYLSENNISFPIRASFVDTGNGRYYPDFEYPEKFIEIKSLLTFDMLIGKRRDYKNQFSIDQLKKIVWTAQHIKPVEINIIENKYIRQTLLINKDFDINTLIEEGKEYETSILLTKEERLEIAKRVGEQQRGKKLTKKHRQNISDAAQERKLNHSDEHKKIYESRSKRTRDKNQLLTDEEKLLKKQKNSERIKKMWEELRKNPEKLAERNRKILEKNKGRTVSQETRNKISNAAKKQWENMDDKARKEHLTNCHNSLVGREVNEDTRRKISETNKITKSKNKDI